MCPWERASLPLLMGKMALYFWVREESRGLQVPKNCCCCLDLWIAAVFMASSWKSWGKKRKRFQVRCWSPPGEWCAYPNHWRKQHPEVPFFGKGDSKRPAALEREALAPRQSAAGGSPRLPSGQRGCWTASGSTHMALCFQPRPLGRPTALGVTWARPSSLLAGDLPSRCLRRQRPRCSGPAAAPLRPDLPGDQVRGRSGDVMVPEAGRRLPRRGTGRLGGGCARVRGAAAAGALPGRAWLRVSVPGLRGRLERGRCGARPWSAAGRGAAAGRGVSDRGAGRAGGRLLNAGPLQQVSVYFVLCWLLYEQMKGFLLQRTRAGEMCSVQSN